MRLTQENQRIREKKKKELEDLRLQLHTENEQIRSSLQTQMENLRIEKDNFILNLENEFEAYRVQSTKTITIQTTEIHTLTTRVQTLTTNNISL